MEVHLDITGIRAEAAEPGHNIHGKVITKRWRKESGDWRLLNIQVDDEFVIERWLKRSRGGPAVAAKTTEGAKTAEEAETAEEAKTAEEARGGEDR